jgi:hypothetical protein
VFVFKTNLCFSVFSFALHGVSHRDGSRTRTQIVNLVGGQYVGQLEYSRDTSTSTWLSVMILPSFAFLRSIYLGTLTWLLVVAVGQPGFEAFDNNILAFIVIYRSYESGVIFGMNTLADLKTKQNSHPLPRSLSLSLLRSCCCLVHVTLNDLSTCSSGSLQQL